MNSELDYRRAKQEFHTFPGKIKWARGLKVADKFGKWGAPFWPANNETLELIREWQGRGLKNVIKKDEDGYYVRFGRKVQRDFRGRPSVPNTAPVVTAEDGETLLDPATVGNGSDVTMKVRLYEHPTPSGSVAIAAELMGVRVDNRIPFEASKDFEPSSPEGYQVRDLNTAPRPTW